jgi:hypothetical protein
MPRVDISEAVMEVLGWCPKFMEAFTSIAGTGPYLDDLDISLATWAPPPKVSTPRGEGPGYRAVALCADKRERIYQGTLR